MKILSLNCQQGYHPALKNFLCQQLDAGSYDLLLLQEVDEKVLRSLDHPSYQFVRSFNEETGQDSLLCIVYRKSDLIIQAGLKSFAYARKDPMFGFKHPAYGLLWADFRIKERMIRVASVHLHSGIDRHARIHEMTVAKHVLLDGAPPTVIVAGDLNAGFPSEPVHLAQVFLPEFVWATKDIGPTLDSRYSENVPHLPNRIAALLSVFNMGIKLRTDHFFIDQENAKKNVVHCSVLSDRVSDHSVVECIV